MPLTPEEFIRKVAFPNETRAFRETVTRLNDCIERAALAYERHCQLCPQCGKKPWWGYAVHGLSEYPCSTGLHLLYGMYQHLAVLKQHFLVRCASKQRRSSSNADA